MSAEGKTALIQSVHQGDRVVPNTEHSHAGDEPGEEPLPQHDVEQPDADCIRRHQSEPQKRSRIEYHADKRRHGHRKHRPGITEECDVARDERARSNERTCDCNRCQKLRHDYLPSGQRRQ